MARKLIWLLVSVLAFVLSLSLLPRESAQAQRGDEEAEAVEVVNFPDVQTVDGAVRVEGPVPLARLESVGQVIAVPADPNDTAALVPAGRLQTDGFGTVTLTLTGEMRGRGSAGRVGALLVPDVPEVRDAFEQGRVLFPLRVEAEVAAQQVWVESEQPRHQLAFPSYRVYLYNTSDRGAAVRLYAYLTN